MFYWQTWSLGPYYCFYYLIDEIFRLKMRWIQEVRLLTVEVVQRAGNKIIIIYTLQLLYREFK